MLEQIINLLPDYCEEISDITGETNLSIDLGLSSMDFMVLLGNIEDKFNIKIADSEIRKLITVGDIVEYVERKIACLL